MSWIDRYSMTVPYTKGYYRVLSPAMLHAALDNAGLCGPDPRQRLNYCELGMGFGVSMLCHAAAFPLTNFFGNDANTVHVGYASALAEAAGLRNVKLFDDTIEEILGRDLPQMDVIVLHGVYSWVSPACRQAIVQFIKQRLSVGGVLYISYNSRVGWAPLSPLRDLIRQHAVRLCAQAMSTDERARQARDFALDWLSLNPAYLEVAPTVKAMVEMLGYASPAYLAHEYFNPEWHPMLFHEVAAELAEAGLQYACPAALEEQIDEAWLDAHQQQRLAAVSDEVMRESLRDLCINPLLRRDLYVRGAIRLPPPAAADRVHARAWQRITWPSTLSTLQLPGPRSALDFTEDAMLVLNHMGPEACSIDELTLNPALSPLGKSRLAMILALLSGAGHVQPALPPQEQSAGTGARTLNAVVLQREGSDGLHHLVSPSTGQAVGWTTKGLRLAKMASEGVTDPRVMASELVRPADPSAGSSDEAEGAVLSYCEHFIAHEVPLLRAMGVI